LALLCFLFFSFSLMEDSNNTPSCLAVVSTGHAGLHTPPRAQLGARLQTARGGGHPSGVERAYYNVRPCRGWRFLVLDPYADAVIGHAEGSAELARGREV
jgi:hypothetical protein